MSITVEEIIGLIQAHASTFRDQESRALDSEPTDPSGFSRELAKVAGQRAEVYEQLLDEINGETWPKLARLLR
jgi:hypothetical protein